jgi:hypothetical protein
MFALDKKAGEFGVTCIENLFFTEYLADASGDQVKVYLYCVYLSGRESAIHYPEDLAEALHLEVGTVKQALNYWERRGVLQRQSQNPPTYTLSSLLFRMISGDQSSAYDEDYVRFTQDVYAIFGERRKVRPAEISKAYDWIVDLKLDPSIVLMLLAYCRDTLPAAFSFNRAQEIAIAMKEAGVKTPEDAESFLGHDKRIREGARQVVRRFTRYGRQPTEDEMNLYKKWVDEWGFSEKDILDACQETVKAVNPSFGYLNSILEGIKNRRQGTKSVKAQMKQESAQLDEVKEFTNRLGLRIAPQTLSTTYQGLVDTFPKGMVMLGAEEIKNRKLVLEDLPGLLQSWQKMGIQTEKDLSAFLEKRSELLPAMRKLLDAAGQKSSISDDDLNWLISWQKIFTEDILLYASERSRGVKSFRPYVSKILQAWQQEGVSSLEQAQNKAPAATAGQKLPAQDFQQRSYTEEELSGGMSKALKEALGIE